MGFSAYNKVVEKIFEYANGNTKYLVKKRDNNILFNRQYNVLLVGLVKNMLFPPILVVFNIFIGVNVAFGGQIEERNRIYVVMATLIIVIYILLISILNRVYFHNDTTFPCGRIIVFGVICGVVIDSFMTYVLGESCFTFYSWCCLVVTVADIVLNELLFKKISLY